MVYNTHEFMRQMTQFYNYPLQDVDYKTEQHNIEQVLKATKEYMNKLPEENTSDAIYKSGVAKGIDMAIFLTSLCFNRLQTMERSAKIENNMLRRELEELKEKAGA